MAGVKVGGVALMGGGLLFAWSGLHGAGISGSLRDLIAGKKPSGSTVNPIAGGAAGGAPGGAPGGSLPTPGPGGYSNGQLQSLWILGGGSPSKAATAACIALHESTGNAKAQSANPDGGVNVGLWQLDTNGKGAGYTVAELENPLTNARVAVAGSADGTDWSAWQTAPLCGVG